MGRCIGLHEDQRVAYIDQTSIFIPFPSEPVSRLLLWGLMVRHLPDMILQGDGTIGLMEVPLSTILEIQVLRQKAESV